MMRRMIGVILFIPILVLYVVSSLILIIGSILFVLSMMILDGVSYIIGYNNNCYFFNKTIKVTTRPSDSDDFDMPTTRKFREVNKYFFS